MCIEQLPTTETLQSYVMVDPERMSGEPVFRGTRVPVKTLFDYLQAGDTLGTFLEDFEGVGREQAAGVIELAARGLIQGRTAA